MEYRIFQYRLPMEGQPEDLNAWLAAHKVVAVEQHLLMDQGLLAGRYLRYLDDAVVWARREDLVVLREKAQAVLASLDLEMKNGGEWNDCCQGLPFPGFVIYPDRIRMGKAGRRRLRRKFSALEKGYRQGLIGERERAERGASLFAHARTGDDVGWRREVLKWHQFGEGHGPGPARRVVEQHRDELPHGVSQQEQAGQPEQEQRHASGFGPRHEVAEATADDVSSRACGESPWAETTDKTRPVPDTPKPRRRKGAGGAPGKGGPA